MKVALINPNLVYQAKDPFTTGIVYMPIGLASFAASLREEGHTPFIVDAFGEAPNAFHRKGEFVYRGLRPAQVVERVHDVEVLFLYASNVTYHTSVLSLIRELRRAHPSIPIVVLENTQAVTAYSLRRVQEAFFEAGATHVLMGEMEERGLRLLEALGDKKAIQSVDGIGFVDDGKTVSTPPASPIQDLDRLPRPAWDLFPLKHYWEIGYAHGPLTSKRYLPILSSRGCPYPCRFCVVPETNNRQWRSRSAENVVDEMEAFQSELGVSEFHFEDLDPTVSDARTQALCHEILRRGLKVQWKLCAGTKVETIKSEETIDLMAEAGCRYISISPESGSQSLMKKMNKPFSYDHAVKMVRRMKQRGIRSQACFVLGFPGETRADRLLTEKMVQDLVREGLDEIAQFIVTPIPGSEIFDQFTGYQDFSQLNFSPTWRSDYDELNRFRLQLYRKFLTWKLRYQPFLVMKQSVNFLRRNFETKMEMTPYRALDSLIRARG